MNKMNKKTLVLILGGLALYLFSASASFAAFSLLGKQVLKKTSPKSQPSAVQNKGGALTFDESLPKTEQCPLNGVLYSKAQRDWWEKHRPLGVMIENHQEARPQSGVGSADVVYEAVAEGGITRFLAVFYCRDAGIVGPVRSARTYYLDFISEYGNDPLYAHVGGANTPGPANALGQIESYGWAAYNDLNQFSISFPTFWRDSERLGHAVATEHTVYANTQKLWDFAAKSRNLTNVNKKGEAWNTDFRLYKFKDEEKPDARPQAQKISFDFWEGYNQYSVKWIYDRELNTYWRENGGQMQKDKDTDKQLQAKNIVFLFMTERNANDGYENNLHLLYGTKGTGKAAVFQDGKKIEGTWQKKDRESRTLILDSKGVEIKFNSGVIWFEILPAQNKITLD